MTGAGSRTAFVFTGGGSLGAVQVGMLVALAAKGVRPDFVVGSSVGAINAAHFAAQPDGVGLPDLIATWRGLRREDVFPVGRLRGMARLLLGRGSLASAGPLRALIEHSLPYRNLEDASIPCHVVAADLRDGAGVLLSSGSAVDALLATSAIPGLFPPVSLAGRTLVDGIVSRETPLRAAVRLGATRLIVLPAGHPCALAEPPRDAGAAAIHAVNLLASRAIIADSETLAASVQLIVAPPLCPLDISAFDFSRTGELIDRARETTAQWIEAGGLYAQGIPGSLVPHRH